MCRFAALFVAVLTMVPCTRGELLRYVDDDAPAGGDGQSWASAYRFLQDALAEAGVHAIEVRVAGGAYRPDESSAFPAGSGDRTGSFLVEGGVALVGGYAGIHALDPDRRDPDQFPTVLDGDLAENDTPDIFSTFDNAFRVVVCNSGSANRLDGVTVRAGYAMGSMPFDRGGGLHQAGGELLVTDCLFQNNHAFDAGGIYASAGTLTIQGCRFHANGAGRGGGVWLYGAEPAHVTDSEFWENTASLGVGLYVSGGASTFIRRCHFHDNGPPHSGAGGGIGVENADPLITDCLFERNHVVGGGGGIITVFSDAIILNCTFVNNLADGDGGDSLYHAAGNPRCWNSALFVDSANPFGNAQVISVEANTEYRHCTIAQHVPSDFTVAFFVQLGSLSLANCIVWGHQVTGSALDDAQIWNLRFAEGQIDVQHSIIQGWSGALGGDGNSGADPAFISLAHGVLRPAPGSPAIDAGHNGLTPADLADLDGDADTSEPLPLDLLNRPRRTDDPLAPDTGPGTSPIVDLGPFESAAWPGDCNADGWITLADLSAYDACFLGPLTPTPCACADLDADSDVDLTDFAAVQTGLRR